MTDDEVTKEYARIMHGVQTGIKIILELDALDGQSVLDVLKQIRVGVDSCKSDTGGLAALLIRKGVFTQEEYNEAILEWARKELEMMERIISERIGRKVELL